MPFCSVSCVYLYFTEYLCLSESRQQKEKQSGAHYQFNKMQSTIVCICNFIYKNKHFFSFSFGHIIVTTFIVYYLCAIWIDGYIINAHWLFHHFHYFHYFLLLLAIFFWSHFFRSFYLKISIWYTMEFNILNFPYFPTDLRFTFFSLCFIDHHLIKNWFRNGNIDKKIFVSFMISSSDTV